MDATNVHSTDAAVHAVSATVVSTHIHIGMAFSMVTGQTGSGDSAAVQGCYVEPQNINTSIHLFDFFTATSKLDTHHFPKQLLLM